jgi:uncharacterized protein YggE
METLITNKNFIKASTALIAILSLFVAVLFINQVKESKYIGRGAAIGSTIYVNGEGEVTAVPDIAVLNFTSSKDAPTAKEAQELLNKEVDSVIAYLKKQNIAEKDISSDYGGVTPKYENVQIYCFKYPCPQGEPKIVGYTATQSISVKIRAVDTANDVRTGLSSLGVQNIYGPTFSIDNEDNLKDQAREKAIKDAREKAEILARQLGVRLGSVVNFSENGGGAYPMMYSAKAGMGGDMSAQETAPVLPKGENKITSSVTITYEIK